MRERVIRTFNDQERDRVRLDGDGEEDDEGRIMRGGGDSGP